MKLVSPIPCSVNHYMKPRPFLAHGKAMVTMYETADAKAYKKQFSKYIKNEIEKQKFIVVPNKTQHWYIDCVFYFDRIDKDCNNYFKLLLDAITDTKLIWLDDNVTCERVNAIYYDSKNPHIDLAIYPVDYIGIFNNQGQLEKFESNCVHCKRYKEGKCSILRSAVEGRIQDEIVDGVCLKKK